MAHRPSLWAGDDRPAVKAIQVLLHRALGAHARNNREGHYGYWTIQDVERWERGQRARGRDIPVSGKSWGARDWELMEPHIRASEEARKYLTADALWAAGRAAEATATRLRRSVIAWGWWSYERRWNLAYRQTRPYAPSIRVARSADCSSWVTLLYKEAGAPDPNGRGYDGYGFTGTLWPRGDLVSTGLAGDLAFYGYHPSIPGAPGHVALCLGGGEVLSFGSYPIRHLPVRYRGDLRGIRRYI